MEAPEGPPGGSPTSGRSSRRGALGLLVAALGILGATAAALFPPHRLKKGEYQRVASWKIPGGEGLFIAVPPNAGPEELRALGEQLRREFGDRRNMVVMVFDDAAAARDVREGSRYIGETRFQAALAHQRAMYLKDAALGKHVLTIFGDPPEVIRY